MLILGADLVAFLRARRVKYKRTCQPGEMYCVGCRAPRAPAGDMADYQPLTATLGNLIGMCPACEAMMYRRVRLAQIEQVRGKLDFTLPQALPHIDESAEPSAREAERHINETRTRSMQGRVRNALRQAARKTGLTINSTGKLSLLEVASEDSGMMLTNRNFRVLFLKKTSTHRKSAGSA